MTQNCRSRSNRHTIGLGITLWGVTVLVGITMLLLANFGAPVWATIASALWLFTAGFPTTLAVIVTAYSLNVYAYRAMADRRSCRVTAGAMFSSILPTSICCTPVVPTLLAVLGASTPQIFGIGGQIQGFFATYEMPILMLALAFMIFAVHLAAKDFSGRHVAHGHASAD